MSKADAAGSDSTVRKHRQRGLIPWKPGQSGNPKGRPQGSRNKLSEQFLADLHASWQVFGRPALMTAAITDPVSFVRWLHADAERARGHHHQLRSVCLTRSSKPLSLEVLKAALILQRRMRTRRSFSRSARLYSVEPAPHSSSSCPSTTCCRCSNAPTTDAGYFLADQQIIQLAPVAVADQWDWRRSRLSATPMPRTPRS